MATTNEYQVTGMTCGHCEMSVREEVGELSGVTDIQVSAQTGRLIVTSEEPLDDAQVITAVEEAGYSAAKTRSEEHTSELQSRGHLVCRLLLEKKNTRHD